MRDDPLPSPKLMWERLQKTLPRLTYDMISDHVVTSDTDPGRMLRRIEIRFISQVVNGIPMKHDAVIYIPAEFDIKAEAARRGKVVIVTRNFEDTTIEGNYGEPIAIRTGYPTMVLLLPGNYGEERGEVKWLRYFRARALETGDPMEHDFIRNAAPYLQALDIFSSILQEKKVRAIIGGHSKRAYYAYTAAAMDPERIAGVIFMGCERLYVRPEFPPAVIPFHTQKYVTCPVFYIGATNEGGYEMFNINRIQAQMKSPWNIEYIPNYRHDWRSEKQFMNWQMWISHVFDGRPLARIGDLTFQETEEGTLFRTRIQSVNKIIQVKAWYVYCDDVPYWRDLVWYPEMMEPKGDGFYEAFIPGKTPDAWLVEVKDIGFGFAGYLSSLPVDITNKPTAERPPSDGRPRTWEPKPENPNKQNEDANNNRGGPVASPDQGKS
jgi:hypothetical protein